MPNIVKNTPEEFDRLSAELTKEAEDWNTERCDCERCWTLENWECNCAQWFEYERPPEDILDDQDALDKWHEAQCECDAHIEEYQRRDCEVEQGGFTAQVEWAARQEEIELPKDWAGWIATIHQAGLYDGPDFRRHYRHEAHQELFDIPIPE